MKLPELALFTSTPGGLRRHLTRRVQGKRIEHQLHLPLKALHRTLQWLLERLAMWSGIVADFFNTHRSTSGAKGIVFIPSPLQVWGEIALLQKAHQTTHAQDYGQDCPANHEFEAPAPWREGFLGRLLSWRQRLCTRFGFLGHAHLLTESLSHATVPNTIRHFAACAMGHTTPQAQNAGPLYRVVDYVFKQGDQISCGLRQVAVTPPHHPDFATQTRFDNIDHDRPIDTGMMRNDTREQGDANPGCDEPQDGLTILAFKGDLGFESQLTPGFHQLLRPARPSGIEDEAFCDEFS